MELVRNSGGDGHGDGDGGEEKDEKGERIDERVDIKGVGCKEDGWKSGHLLIFEKDAGGHFIAAVFVLRMERRKRSYGKS